MEKVLPVLQVVEEERKANPPPEQLPQMIASDTSTVLMIPDAHLKTLEPSDSTSMQQLKCAHNAKHASSTVETKLRDQKSTLEISPSCPSSAMNDQRIATGSFTSASEEVSHNDVIQKETYEVKQPDHQGVS